MGQSLAIPRVIPNDWKRLDLIVNKIKMRLGRDSTPTFSNINITNIITASTSVFSEICTVAAGLNVLRVIGLQTDATALTGTLRGAYIDVSNGSLDATGTIRGMELKARTEAPGDTGNDVAVLEGLSISADSKSHSVTTMRAAEFILDGSLGGTIDEAVGLRIANNLQADKATLSYGLQIYRDSFDYTYDISLSLGGHITGDTYASQDYRVTADPTFAALTVTTLNGVYITYTPTGNYAIGDSGTLANLDATPTYNIAIGTDAGNDVTDGDHNILIGRAAGEKITTQSYNVCIGGYAGQDLVQPAGSNNTLVGASAGTNLTSSSNVGIGQGALALLVLGAGRNTAIGAFALEGYGAGTKNAAYNVGIGYHAGFAIDSGDYNVLIGNETAVALTNGNHNTIVGSNAATLLTTGSENVFLGYLAGCNQVGNSNLLIIDNQNRASAANEITNAMMYGVFGGTPSAQSLRINAKIIAGLFAAPMDTGGGYGIELHYSGDDVSVTGIRSRAQLVTTDTTATAQGAVLQAANNDGIDVGVLNGALIEAIGKSNANAATIAMMRGTLINTEWGAYDTITTLHTLHVRLHSLNNAGAGSFGTGYGIYIENEAVGGNGQALDAGIYFKGTNLSAGNKAFIYGIDFTGATYETADINLQKGIINLNGVQYLKLDTADNFLAGCNSFQNDNGQYNIGVGCETGYNNDTTGAGLQGDRNIYMGYRAGYGLTGGSNNTGYDNVAIGYQSLTYNTTGYYNTAIGSRSLLGNSTGINNFALGFEALRHNEAGGNNVAIGYQALWTANTFGNVAIGGTALRATTGRDNIGIGKDAANKNVAGKYNIAIGTGSMYQTVSGDENVIIGYLAGLGVSVNSYSDNIFIGSKAGYSTTTGSQNIYLGYNSGYRQTTNSNRLIIDNRLRADANTELTNAILYGVMAATPADQTLRINAQTEVHGLVIQVVAKTGAYTLTAIDDFVECDASGGAFTITLPAVASTTTGKVYHIKKIDSSVNVVTVDGNASETIDGGTTASITTQYECITIINNDSEWWII